ncbi:divalent cation transporter [Ureibacillus massiliensis 4400831 = CIP 108448 = CCUG 49529]|uniref:Divalent cation transporter n=1 Tax=Ureibacillus massiliensis 4400831 = CIP 108448 = CCUG 49529 TaxID=1211035 RepID=A0A0A3IYI2_9BACL|nr:divalent cation transporter [Ureibacillus massiliensis 4400831 = CIP 108448 = CCUG 49529]
MLLFGFLYSSLGFLIGGAIAWLFKEFKEKISIINAVCAGLIFGLISIEIFPKAIELGGWFITIVGVTIGMIIFELLHKVSQHNQMNRNISKERIYNRVGLLLILSFSIHNFPMGITLATSQEYDFTISLLQTILFHNIPEGIILYTPLIMMGINFLNGILISFFVSVPVALGFFIGSFVDLNHPFISTSLISFTVGIILMVTVSEILLPVMEKSTLHRILIYTLIGIGIMGIYLKLF